MVELTDFLLVRIAEDEALVLDHWDSDGKARVATMWTGGEPGHTTVASDQRDDAWFADGREVEDARHVQVLFDPARVLAECEAKRRIVEGLRGIAENTVSLSDSSPHAVLRHLASVYADHPDYRDEWRP